MQERGGGESVAEILNNPQIAKSKSMIGQPTGGVQASEEIFPSLLDTQIKKYQEFMGGADIFVPEVILERPRKRLTDVEQLREEILHLNTEI